MGVFRRAGVHARRGAGAPGCAHRFKGHGTAGERGGPVFPHFRVCFSGTIGFVVPIQRRRWCVALVRGCRKGLCGRQSVGVAVIPCAHVLRGGCCFVWSCSEGTKLYHSITV